MRTIAKEGIIYVVILSIISGSMSHRRAMLMIEIRYGCAENASQAIWS
jgi:hypothetical protein